VVVGFLLATPRVEQQRAHDDDDETLDHLVELHVDVVVALLVLQAEVNQHHEDRLAHAPAQELGLVGQECKLVGHFRALLHVDQQQFVVGQIVAELLVAGHFVDDDVQVGFVVQTRVFRDQLFVL